MVKETLTKIEVKSTEPPSVNCPLDTAYMERAFLDYLCIKEPKGDMLVPGQWNNIIFDKDGLLDSIDKLIEQQQLTDLNVNDCYWYLSIKNFPVNPQSCQTKDEWHIDGFLRDDYNFIWSNALPTLYAVGDFKLTPDRYASLEEYNQQIVNAEIKSTIPGRLYYLDRACVHRPVANMSTQEINRVFIKVTITKRLFNSTGNGWNYLIPHIKPNGIRTNFN